MRTRPRPILLACTVGAIVLAGGVTATTSPLARAQAAPTGPSVGSGSSSCPSSNPPNELVLGGGTPQTAQLGAAFANPLQVALANSDGCPITTAVTGTVVTFTAPASGPSATFAASGSNTLTVGADATGSASVQMLAANGTPGAYTVTASSAYGTVSFSLTNTGAGIPATITPVAPASQQAPVNGRYAQPIAVRVLDANGNPVAGANVTFSLGSSGSAGAGAGSAETAGASFDDGTSQATETTNANGVATSPGLRANATSGAFTATATVQHATEPASFTLRNLAAKPNTAAPVGSSSRTATIGTHYAQRLRVRVRDASGAPVADATVTFTLGSSSAASAGSGGAGATFTGGSAQATATTGPHGIATSPRLAANEQAGSFTATATASVGGASAVAIFHLHNYAGAPSTVTAGVGAAQSASAGTRFAIPLAVTVSDAHGNHAVNVRVTFTAPSSGPGGSFAAGQTKVTVRTNSSGIAIAPPFTANGQAGGYIVTATVNGARPVAFALVNDPA